MNNTIKLSDIPILVINLPYRTDRLASIKSQLEKQDWWKRTEIVEGSLIKVHGTGTAGIAHSHMRCLQLAKERKYEYVIILQDDAQFLMDKEKINDHLQYFLDHAPPNWSGLWFGSYFHYYPQDQDKNHPTFVRPCTFWQDTAMLIPQRYYDTLIAYNKICYEGYMKTGDEMYNTDQLMQKKECNGKENEWFLIKRDQIFIHNPKLCGQALNYSDRTFQTMGGDGPIALPLQADQKIMTDLDKEKEKLQKEKEKEKEEQDEETQRAVKPPQNSYLPHLLCYNGKFPTLANTTGQQSTIPRLLHLIWVGPLAIPDYVSTNIKKWKTLLPETWSVKMWTNDNISTEHFPDLIVEKINNCTIPAQMADIMRFFIIKKYGGVYMDTDFQPIKSLEPLLNIIPDTSLYICHDNYHTWAYVASAFFATNPESPTISYICNQLLNDPSIQLNNKSNVHFQTGPGLLGKGVHTISNEKKEKIVLLPMTYLYDVHNKVSVDKKFALHTYAASWVK